MTRDYDSRQYDNDFPPQGKFNWKTVRLTMPGNVYWDGARLTGVILHDGKFMSNGVLFNEHEFVIIDETPYEV